MKNYTVSIYVSETQTDTFTIKAKDLETAQRDAMTEAVDRGYSIDDVIDVVEIETLQDNVVDCYLDKDGEMNILGILILRKYTHSTVRINGKDMEYKEFCKDVDANIKLYCDMETILAYAFSKNVKFIETGIWGNETFYNIIEKKKEVKAIRGEGNSHGLIGTRTGACIIIQLTSGPGIPVDPEHFFGTYYSEKIQAGKRKGFLFPYDQGYRECFDRYPDLADCYE